MHTSVALQWKAVRLFRENFRGEAGLRTKVIPVGAAVSALQLQRSSQEQRFIFSTSVMGIKQFILSASAVSSIYSS